MVLSDLSKGQTAIIKRLNCSPSYRKKLLEIGVLEGEKVMLVRTSLFLDPIEIKVRGFCLAIRASVAKQIEVEQI